MLSFRNQLKEGEFMTRVCASASHSKLYVSVDSLYTNTLNHTTSINNIKLSYNNNIIVALLGISELFTAMGKISIKDIIQDFLNTHQKSNLETLYNLQEEMVKICNTFKFTKPCLILYMWKQDNKFYMYYYDVSYSYTSQFGEKTIINSPLKPVSESNLKFYEFTNYFINAGDGLQYNPTILKLEIDNELNLFDFTAGHVQQAVLDDSIPTVGGPVYTITLDLKGNIETYINGKRSEW